MDRIVLKRSTIFVSVGEDLQIFRSMREVPPRLRKKLIECTTAASSEVIIIADRRGKKEIEKALESLPPESRTRFEAAVKEGKQGAFSLRRFRPWPEILLALITALIVLAAVYYR